MGAIIGSAVSCAVFFRSIDNNWNITPYLSYFWVFGFGWLIYADRGLRLRVLVFGMSIVVAVAQCHGDLWGWGLGLILPVSAVLFQHKLVLTGKLKALATWAGDVSFPLYATHSAIVFLVVHQWSTFATITIFANRALLIPCLIFAIFTLYVEDKPLRALGSRNASPERAQKAEGITALQN